MKVSFYCQHVLGIGHFHRSLELCKALAARHRITGPYCDNERYRMLSAQSSKNITIERFTDHFPEWLEAADLSISMAGYRL